MADINWLERAKTVTPTLTINNIINGKTLPAQQGAKQIEKYSPRDGSLLYSFGEGTREDVDNAVAAALEAYNEGPWPSLPIAKRAAVLNLLAELLEEHHDELMLNECLDVGKTVSISLKGEISRSTGRLRSAAGLAPKIESKASADQGHMSFHRCKPVGVVGAVCGWNYPLAMACNKIAAALVMGNTMVLKPSEFTCLSTWRLAELALEAGVPPGVLNVVNGAGAIVGDAIARHRDVALVSFVGSTATGRQVMAAAGESNMKRVILECGGKSPYIVFDDCPDDLDAIASAIVAKAFLNQGALCVASSRLLVQNTIRLPLLERVCEKTRALVPGDPLDPNTNFGALVNEAHMYKVLNYIDIAKQQGEALMERGRFYPEGDPDLRNGFYIPPNIFTASPNDTIVQEEIFGPVLAVQSFDTDDEAIALANGTSYGLAAYAATTSLPRARKLEREICVGTLSIYSNMKSIGSGMALGADKHDQSGCGMSGGMAGLWSHCIPTLVHEYT